MALSKMVGKQRMDSITFSISQIEEEELKSEAMKL